MNMSPSEKAASDLMQAVNRLDFNPKEFAGIVCSEHRTLQQGAMRAFVECVLRWAEDASTGQYDLRNQSSVLFARKIVEDNPTLDPGGFPII